MIFSPVDQLAKSMEELEALTKAFGAKDYSKLVKVKKQDSAGHERTYWVSPEDEKQGGLFDSESEGKESASGSRGYYDHLDQTMNDSVIKPLIEKIKETDPSLAPKFQHKYASYPFDRDTKELDVKIDLDTLWYMKKIKENPSFKAEYEEEYGQKVDRLVKQVNNRKKAMLKVKAGDTVKYHGREAIVTDFSKRGFPVLDVGGKKENAFWEEIAS